MLVERSGERAEGARKSRPRARRWRGSTSIEGLLRLCPPPRSRSSRGFRPTQARVLAGPRARAGRRPAVPGRLADCVVRDWAALTELAAVRGSCGNRRRRATLRRGRPSLLDDTYARGTQAWFVRWPRSWRRPGFSSGVQSGVSDAIEIGAHRHPYAKFFTGEELATGTRRFDGSVSPVQERARGSA